MTLEATVIWCSPRACHLLQALPASPPMTLLTRPSHFEMRETRRRPVSAPPARCRSAPCGCRAIRGCRARAPSGAWPSAFSPCCQ